MHPDSRMQLWRSLKEKLGQIGPIVGSDEEGEEAEGAAAPTRPAQETESVLFPDAEPASCKEQ